MSPETLTIVCVACCVLSLTSLGLQYMALRAIREYTRMVIRTFADREAEEDGAQE